MDSLERELWREKIPFVAGIDEVGRGSLAGPVVAGAVVFEPDVTTPPGINDSKKLTPRVRERLYDEIMKSATAVGFGVVYQEDIDRMNIVRATFEAMKRAVADLQVRPGYLLVDGIAAPDFGCPCTPVVKGDARSVSIAAASIIAKVFRDRMMVGLDARYPEYGFKNNKGYASAFHIEAIRRHGLSVQHRITFCQKILNPQMTFL